MTLVQFTPEQIMDFRRIGHTKDSTLRLFCGGLPLDIGTMTTMPKGTNVIYQAVIWDYGHDAGKFLTQALSVNNPNHKFTFKSTK